MPSNVGKIWDGLGIILRFSKAFCLIQKRNVTRINHDINAGGTEKDNWNSQSSMATNSNKYVLGINLLHANKFPEKVSLARNKIK